MVVRRLAAVAALALVLGACTAGAGSGGQLEGTRWVLDSYDVDGTLTILPDSNYADADFRGSTRMEGFAGCNQYDAVYQARGRTFRVTQPSATRMACSAASMDFEQRYLSLLDESRFYTVRAGTLTVFNRDRTSVLVFDAAPKNPLLGAWRVDSYESAPGTIVSAIEGTQLDVVFRIANVGGFAGCNDFRGAYGTNGDAVRIGAVAATSETCDQPLMDQEAAVLRALDASARIERRGEEQLNLTDRSGNLLLALIRPPEDVASASPEATAVAQATPSATVVPSATRSPPAATPTPAVTPPPPPASTPTPPTPTAEPTPAVSPTPAGTPIARPSVRPTASLPALPSPSIPIDIPPTASCELGPPDGAPVAVVVYPGSWFTVTEPAALACRYFDPAEIVVPTDPATLETAVEADLLAMPHADAIAAATNPASWTVSRQWDSDVRGVAVSCVAAVALTDAAGIPVGDESYGCLVDVGTAGTVAIRATGTPGDEALDEHAAVVGLMTIASTFTPPA